VCWKCVGNSEAGLCWSGEVWTLGGAHHLQRGLGAETQGGETVGRPRVVPRQREGRARRAPHHLWCHEPPTDLKTCWEERRVLETLVVVS